MSDTKKIKMVATDIDGTILKWDFGFTPEVKECIKKLSAGGLPARLNSFQMYIKNLYPRNLFVTFHTKLLG